ncbi:MAG: VTT domain-containing protein [Dehalococcoidia bacterium]|nr:VTT domain-containing protein [Dehalococcoidia bacterium]
MECGARRRGRLLAALSVGATIVLCVLIVQHRGFVDQISHWGYVGLFLVNVLASGTLVLPGMGAVITFTLGGVLQPALVGVVAGFGEATGAVGAYLTGYGGRGLLIDGPSGARFTALMQRHGSKAMFIMAALVNPIYYPFAVWMGVLRVRIGKFFLYTLAGRILKNLLLAYLGYFGMRTVLRWLGLPV